MKINPLYITIINFTLITIPAFCGEPTPEKSLEQIEHESIYSGLRKIEQKRAAIQALPDYDPIRTRHIAELHELYDRAKTAQDMSMQIAVHTELRRFGITIPKEFSLRLNDDQTVKPVALVHPTTHVIYYLESDGRHVSAIAPDGTILWHRDPFNDRGLEPYRCSKPVIVHFDFSSRDPKTTRIEINFNSSQFGDMDLTTGDFHWGGQN